MSVIRNLVLSLKARTGDHDKKIRRSQQITKSMTKTVAKMAAGFGALVIAAKGIRALSSSFERLDKLAKTSARLGINAAQLKGLQFAGEQAGFGIEVLNKALVMQVRNVGDAAQGTGEAMAAMKELGLNAQQLTQMSPDRAFVKIGDAIKNIKNQQDRLRLTADIFGGRGTVVLNLLQQTTKEIEKQVRIGTEASGLSGKSLKAIEDANDAANRMSKIWEGIVDTIAMDLAPVLKDLVEAIAGHLKNIPGKTISTVNQRASGRFNEIGSNLRAASAGKAELFNRGKLQELRVETRKDLNTTIRKLNDLEGSVFKMFRGERIKLLKMTLDTLKQQERQLRTLQRTGGGLQAELNRDLGDKSFRNQMDGQAEAARAAIEAARAQKRLAMDQARVKDIVSATRTPLEKFNKEMTSLNRLFKSGALDQQTFRRAAEQATAAAGLSGPKLVFGPEGLPESATRILLERVKRAAEKRRPRLGPEGPIAALERGSQAALSEINRIKAQQDARDPEKKQVDELKKANQKLEQQVAALQEIAENTGDTLIARFA